MVSVKIHTKHALEFRISLPDQRKTPGNSAIKMDMYLFMPPALDVRPHNFSKSSFYRTLKSYLRLSVPEYDLDSLTDPLSDINISIQVAMAGDNVLQKNSIHNAIDLIKGHTLSVVRARTSYVRSIGKDVCFTDMEKVVLTLPEINRKIRLLHRSRIEHAQRSGADKSLIDALRFSDEYMSLMYEVQLYDVLKLLTRKNDSDGDLAKVLHAQMISEIKYRDDQGYPSVVSGDNDRVRQLHRRGRLKRFFESNLFLYTSTRKEGVFFEQLFLSLAAGLAMIFATTVAFASQAAFGNLTLPFFAILVISYMFKDRIKELLRVYFERQHKRMTFDFKTEIQFRKGVVMGVLKESFRFEDRRLVPAQVMKAREMMRVTEITEERMDDQIIHYKTRLDIYGRKVRKMSDFSGVTHIIRMNIDFLTMKMDDQQKTILVRKKATVKRSKIHRLYHVNILLRFDRADVVYYEYYKLVLSRRGVEQLYPVSLIK